MAQHLFPSSSSAQSKDGRARSAMWLLCHCAALLVRRLTQCGCRRSAFCEDIFNEFRIAANKDAAVQRTVADVLRGKLLPYLDMFEQRRAAGGWARLGSDGIRGHSTLPVLRCRRSNA